MNRYQICLLLIFDPMDFGLVDLLLLIVYYAIKETKQLLSMKKKIDVSNFKF